MTYDLLVRGSVHRVYVVGLAILVGVHGLGLAMAGTAAGQAVSRVLARFADAFGVLY